MAVWLKSITCSRLAITLWIIDENHIDSIVALDAVPRHNGVTDEMYFVVIRISDRERRSRIDTCLTQIILCNNTWSIVTFHRKPIDVFPYESFPFPVGCFVKQIFDMIITWFGRGCIFLLTAKDLYVQNVVFFFFSVLKF